MKMTVRACVLAVVLVVLGTGSVFGQVLNNPTNGATPAAGSPFNSFLVGAPAGSVYAGSNHFNLAMNREGNKELGAAVSLCAGTVGGVAASGGAGTTSTFNTGDVYTLEYQVLGTAPLNDPIFAAANTGALGSANLAISQNGVGAGVTATASAAMFQPAVVAGATVIPPPKAIVTITITAAPAPGTGINCIAIQGMRFDLGNSNVSATLGALGMANANTIIAVVNETSVNGTVAAVPIVVVNAAPNTTTSALAGNTFGGVNGGLPSVVTNAVGTAYTSLGTIGNGALGLANGTGLVTGGFSTTASSSTKSGFAGVAPSVTIGGRAGSGTVSVQEGAVPSATAAVVGVNSVTSSGVALTTTSPAITVNLPIADGGGLFRGFVASGPDTTNWLNASGATTGTQVLLTVAGMPAGSSVVFPASVSSASPGVVLNMTGGGTISAPGGSVTYSTTVNEGISTALAPAAAGVGGNGVGPSVDIPFTVNAGTAAGGGTTIVITLAPVAGASATPTYSGINAVTVIPSQAVGAAQTTLFTVATNQSTRTFPYVTFTGGTTSADYDTGLALTNAGRTVSVVAGASCNTVPAGGTIPTGCGGPFAGTVSTNGTNIGQDGPFTIFLVSSGTTVASIRSTASNFPNASKLSSGNLVQGSTWVALLSQITAAAGVTGAWSGELVIVADFPQSNGFVFVSQFTNPGGGATMGYKVTAIAGEN